MYVKSASLALWLMAINGASAFAPGKNSTTQSLFFLDTFSSRRSVRMLLSIV